MNISSTFCCEIERLNQHLYAFVIDKLTERPEVADVRTSVIYEHLRNPAIVPDPGTRA